MSRNTKPEMLTSIDPDSMAHPCSAFRMPPEVRFSDNREGREARLLIAGYADMLADAARSHAPVQTIREIIATITDVATRAVAAEIRRAHAMETMQ